jgi:hypothetical protein
MCWKMLVGRRENTGLGIQTILREQSFVAEDPGPAQGFWAGNLPAKTACLLGNMRNF